MANNTSLKEEIVKLLDSVEDESVLYMLKENVAFYATAKDATDTLTEEQYKELELLANEPDDKDVVSLEEFQKSTSKWRTGL